ncbi:hypothetical protein BJ912DRAFT_1052854 [Pholiota molesta]|nr:hypothetical protein BJ912DRAFT_1052854 [Pholiota molesta]
MVHFYALLAVATTVFVSFARCQVVESRETGAKTLSLLPIPSLSVINFTGIDAFITIDTLVTNTISLNISIQNLLPLEVTLDSLAVDAGLNGTVVATFTQSFPSPGLVVPALGTANSGTIDNVALPQGAIGLLAILPFGILDLSNVNATTRQLSINGVGGIPVPLSGLSQTSVPTNYSLASCAPS